MKISEMIALLQKELKKRGDVDVQLWGVYGGNETTFEVMPDKHVLKEHRDKLNIYTGINTG